MAVVRMLSSGGWRGTKALGRGLLRANNWYAQQPEKDRKAVATASIFGVLLFGVVLWVAMMSGEPRAIRPDAAGTRSTGNAEGSQNERYVLDMMPDLLSHYGHLPIGATVPSPETLQRAPWYRYTAGGDEWTVKTHYLSPTGQPRTFVASGDVSDTWKIRITAFSR